MAGRRLSSDDVERNPSPPSKKSASKPVSNTKKLAAESQSPSAERFWGQDSERSRNRDDEFYSNMHAISDRLKKVEGAMDAITSLALKVEHSWSHLATKEDVSKAAHNSSLELSSAKESLLAEIRSRPTTVMLFTVAGFIVAFLTLFAALFAVPGVLEWWRGLFQAPHSVAVVTSHSNSPPQAQVPQPQPPGR